MSGQPGTKRVVAAAPEAPADAAPESTLSRLESHFRTLDEGSLVRVAAAVEKARATETGAASDEQILTCLRPMLRSLRPVRVPTFQRALCVCLEPYLIDGDSVGAARRAVVARSSLAPWWRLLMGSPYRPRLAAATAEYRNAVASERQDEIDAVVQFGRSIAAEATTTLLAEAAQSAVRKRELEVLLGSERAFGDAAEIARILGLDPLLTPWFDQIRAVCPRTADGRVHDFNPQGTVIAKNGYMHLHAADREVVDYYFHGLLRLLAQPWQSLRLVRLLSADLLRAGGDSAGLQMIPAKLFGDLTRTLAEIGRTATGDRGMTRRVWLMTCARLISDAGAMVQGMAEEVKEFGNAGWETMMVEARQKVTQAADQFASVAVRDAALVLPQKEVREKLEVRLVPDMAHSPSDDEVSVAQAAATLFTACRKVAEKEGFDRSIRAKEADLEATFQTAINFRFEYLRARGKNKAVSAQLQALEKVLRSMPKTEPMLDLILKAERAIERFR
ncbi:hypothetical protein VPG91_28270 [Nitrospirillum amazonense]|uniref:Uncharacterized protein n=1 Tax=Nitrospirillum amazonense TaxID=28077 RepID=A0A560FVR3_9PROT|nr:hypothetical protein [Nitrospirillum amazonense]MEC4594920.1 hypothetical protein [Nitrospirillum amazonense]TWB25736.1 hypothetical protein FBZ88_109134 [Nitrospirillum amazonense]